MNKILSSIIKINQTNWESGLKSKELEVVRKYFGLNQNEGLLYSYMSMEDETSIHQNFFERIGLPKYTINGYIKELVSLTIRGLVYIIQPFHHYSDGEKNSLVEKDNVGNMDFRTNKSVLLSLDRDKYDADVFVNYITLVVPYLSVSDFMGLEDTITDQLSKSKILNNIGFGKLNFGEKWLLSKGLKSLLEGKNSFEISIFENYKIEGIEVIDGFISKEKTDLSGNIIYKINDELIGICNKHYPKLFVNEISPF